MSEKMTRIRLPGQKIFTGLQEYGEQTASDMILRARQYSAWLREQAKMIDVAADSDFQVDVVRGPYVQHHIKELQRSSVYDRQNEKCAS